jgi:cobaltochelatase CobN
MKILRTISKIFFASLALSAAVLTPAACLAGDGVALLVIDGDSYVAHQAVSELGLPDRFTARAFCLSDLDDEANARFLDEASLIVVDIMDDNLSSYVIDRGLLGKRPVFALRGSKDDSYLIERGFVFNDELLEYFSHLSKDNIVNMLRRAVNLTLDDGVAYEPVRVMPENGVYHPSAADVFGSFKDYANWYEKSGAYGAGRPWLGLMFFSTSLADGQREAFDDLIAKLEAGGFNVIPAFGTDIVVIDEFFLDADRKSRVDAVLTFSLKFYMSLDDRLKSSVEALDVPIFNAITLYSLTKDEWLESEQGIAPLDVIWTMATPEISGAIEPTPLIGKVEDRYDGGGRVYRYELIEGMTERVIPRIHNWIRLRGMPNAEKNVAILYYNNSQGKQNIGASYLNVFRSLEEITARMGDAGYSVSGDAPLDEEAIKGLALRGGRNVASWAPGELDALIAEGQAFLLPVEEYKKWFAELPEDFRRRVNEQWGDLETGGADGIMIRGGSIVIPMIRAGNIVMMPEPARGITDDPMKLYHDPHLYPHHQYIAAYLWLERNFGADAMIHLGTHATYEWLPGKQAGLSLSCPPEVMITDIPNVYPYIVDDVGEGIQAKRRGRGVVVDHLTPLLTEAEGYHEYLELAGLCEAFRQADSFASATSADYLAQVRDLALKLGLHNDLEMKDVTDRDDVERISIYLEYLEKGHVPYGLHTFGRSPSGGALDDTVEAILAQNRALPAGEVRARLSASGGAETGALLAALEGRYVFPAEGNDPVRNPDAIPTGRNFYGISPNRLPTPAAWELGQRAADEIVGRYLEENDGEYPGKVAVVLWAVESLRNEGVNESTILALIGVEPVWNSGGQITGTRPIPGSRLNRPRIDVAINASGLYRDLFPDKILFLDAAIRQAAAQDDLENFIARNDERIRRRLIESGVSEEDAGRFSKVRVFSEAPGAYGNRVEELTSASGLWEDDSAIADVYLKHTGFAYGGGVWGEASQAALSENLRDAKVAWHSVSSNVYSLMDNDDMFMYLGGLSLAIRTLSGEAPRTLITDQRTKGEAGVETLNRFLGQEMRARYLNPKWIEGMKAENYAGAREMSNYAEYLWGWQVTAPEAVDEAAWRQTYEVYVEDKYALGIREFMDENNAWAYQSLTSRMLETTRKGYWDADEEVRRKLAAEYATSVVRRGLACCDHTCNNPQFHQMVMNIISIPGLMSPELVAEFKLAVENAGQKTIDEMVADRQELLRDLGSYRTADSASGAAQSDTPEESVKGFKMEDIENSADDTSVPSSGVEWFAALFVLAILAVFFSGFRRRR